MLDRRTTIALALALLGAGVLAWFSPSIITSSDIGIAELYTDLASRGRLLLGPYSRFGWHHPGPLYFYLLAPLYALAGRSGAALYLAAVLINGAAVGLLLRILIVERRFAAGIAVACGCLAVAIRVGGYFSSPWTANIVAFPTIAFIAACAAVAAGRTGLLPVAAFAASFIVETDLALVPAVAAVTLVTVIALARRSARTRNAPVRDITTATIVSLIAWTPTIIDAVSNRGGNVSALWRFFVSGGGRAHGVGEALRAWSYGLIAVARPQLGLPWGKLIDLQAMTWQAPAAVGLAALLVVSIALAARKHAFDAWLGTMSLAALAASFWAVTRIRGDLFDYEVFWLAPLGAMAGTFAIASIATSLRPLIAEAVLERPTAWIFAATMLFLAIVGVGQAEQTIGLAQRLEESHDVRNAVSAIETHLTREHARAVLIDVTGSFPFGAPIVLQLRQHHWRVAVTPASIFIFTDAYAASGREDSWLKIQAGRRPAAQGSELIFDSRNVGVIAFPSEPGG